MDCCYQPGIEQNGFREQCYAMHRRRLSASRIYVQKTAEQYDAQPLGNYVLAGLIILVPD